MIEKLFLLICGHAVADFALQSDWMAKNKNRNNPSTYLPPGQIYTPTWFYVLGAHSFIHGLMVYLVTGDVIWGIIETISHFIIDFAKCESRTNPHEDQFMHLLMKLVYLGQVKENNKEMKLIKHGTITENEDGSKIYSGFHIDCEGGAINLTTLTDELEQLSKILVDGE